MIILASTSATRQTLLKNAGIRFSVVEPQVDERKLANGNPHWSPEETSRNLAAAKSKDVSVRYPDALVIGSDQVLAFGSTIYSKPTDIADCRRQLSELRGHTHQLISSVGCSRNGTVTWSVSDTAELTMRNFTGDFLDSYLNTNALHCQSSVGGYQIEGLGLQLFEAIEGNHFTILGLPLLPLLHYLRSTGEIGS